MSLTPPPTPPLQGRGAAAALPAAWYSAGPPLPSRGGEPLPPCLPHGIPQALPSSTREGSRCRLACRMGFRRPSPPYKGRGAAAALPAAWDSAGPPLPSREGSRCRLACRMGFHRPSPPFKGRGAAAALPAAWDSAGPPLPSRGGSRCRLACRMGFRRPSPPFKGRGAAAALPAAWDSAGPPLPSRGGVGGGVCNIRSLNHDLELSARVRSRSEMKAGFHFAHLITTLSFQLEFVHFRK